MQSQTSVEEQRAVLVPITNNSLNVASNFNHSATSRKRKNSDLNGSDTEVFTANLLSAKDTISFTAITVIARACLPLAWLDSAASITNLVFEASIPFVELWEQRVLIARKVPNGSLYAVEQVAPDTFVACALCGWVSEAWCHNAAIGMIAKVRVEDLVPAEDDGSQRSHSRTGSRSQSVSQSAALPTPTSPKRPKNRKGALARMSILAPKAGMAASPAVLSATGSPVDPQQALVDVVVREVGPDASFFRPLVQEPVSFGLSPETSLHNPFDITMHVEDSVVPESEPLSVPDPAPTIPAADFNPLATERLRNQYFEHLYTSKTSLAFYVKGPLARARAHVRSAEDAAKAIKELSEFYEQSILPAKKVDLKYKESVAKVVKELPIPQGDAASSNLAELKKHKMSRKKKVKLGKDCLWSEEEDFIAKWWRGRDLHGTVAAIDQAEELRQELADLRMRETKMQLLLILEVMLLETAASKMSESEQLAMPADPSVKIESIEEDSATAVLAVTPYKEPRREKKRDWAAEVDVIVDRLCIWHTVSLGDIGNIASHKSSNNGENGGAASKPNDSLRDFCKDVLLPFYSAKLPVQIKAMSRKLGGPERSPLRSKPARPLPGLHRSSSSMSAVSKGKPGQPLSKRTLERVLSEDHQLLRHVSPPTFSRAPSFSTPVIPTLKREPSERPASRGGMLSKPVSFSNREIDLVADQKLHDAKRRKIDNLAQQKKDLQTAIAALKKPDRRTVASQIMDEAEERKRLELEKKLAVQISATPRSRRFQGQSQPMEEPQLPPMPRLVAREQEVATVIPSSTMKPRLRFGMSSSTSMPRSSAAKLAVLAGIHDTPSRGLEGKTSNPIQLRSLSPSASGGRDPTEVATTPVPNRTARNTERFLSPELILPSSQPIPSSSQLIDAGGGLLMKRSRRQVLFTPVKKSEAPLDQIFKNAPVIPEQAGHMMDRVMGGRGRGMEEDFESLRGDLVTKPKSKSMTEAKVGSANGLGVDDDDIYEKLGWNDDFDL